MVEAGLQDVITGGLMRGAGVERSRPAIDQSWFWGVKLAVATGIAYFLAGRLGLVLRVEPGLAIFWPALGISVGALIALGPRARLPVAAAVFVASAACGLTMRLALGRRDRRD